MESKSEEKKSVLKSITFEVAKVTPTGEVKPRTADLEKLVSEISKKSKVETATSNFPVNVERRIRHALVDTVFTAYSDHHPLELSADDFWVLIAQGITMHINANPEKYRKLLVNHEDKKTLEVSVDELKLYPIGSPSNVEKWPVAVDMLVRLLQADMKADLVKLLTAPFSTSGSVEQTVLNCTMLDAAKAFYNYRISVCCGLPLVTLHGTSADFEDMLRRLDTLEGLFPDAKWWFDSMRPHLKELRETAAGKPNIEFWNKICHRVGGGSDISMLAGWLADFIPYVDNGNGGYRRARTDYVHYTQGKINGIDYSDFGQAVSITDFVFNNNGKELPMSLVAGFFGTHQNPVTKTLRPVVGWSVVFKEVDTK